MISQRAFISTILTVTLYIFIHSTSSFGQLSNKVNLETEGKKYFQLHDFKSALKVYKELESLFPQEPRYQYFIGRCLLELDEDFSYAVKSLKFSAVKGDNNNAWFYLGKAYHLKNEFDEAVQAYKRFIHTSKRPVIRKLKGKEYLAKAEKKIMLKNNTISTNEIKKEKNFYDKNSPPTIKKTDYEITEEKKEVLEPNEITIHPEKNESNNLAHSDKNNETLSTALDLQLKADSLKRLAKTKRSELRQTAAIEDRNKLKTEISALEKESLGLQHEADKNFMLAESNTDNDIKSDTLPEFSAIELKEIINGIKVYQYKENFNTQHSEENKNSSLDKPENKTANPGISSNTDGFIINEKPVYNVNNPIPARNPLSDNLTYFIQLGVYSKQLPDSTFGGLYPVCFDAIKSKGLFKYYVGRFNTYTSAEIALQQVKTYGFPDSFIIVFYKGKQINIKKAK